MASASLSLGVAFVYSLALLGLLPLPALAFDFFISDQQVQRITGTSFGSARYYFVRDSSTKSDVVTNLNSAFSLGQLLTSNNGQADVELNWSQLAPSTTSSTASMKWLPYTAADSPATVTLLDSASQQPLNHTSTLTATNGGVLVHIQCVAGSSGREATVGVRLIFTVRDPVDWRRDITLPAFRLNFPVMCRFTEAAVPSAVSTATVAVHTEPSVSTFEVMPKSSNWHESPTAPTDVRMTPAWPTQFHHSTTSSRTSSGLESATTVSVGDHRIRTWILVTVACTGVLVLALVLITIAVACRMACCQQRLRSHANNDSGGKSSSRRHVLPPTAGRPTQCLGFGMTNFGLSKLEPSSSSLLLADKFIINTEHLTLGPELGKGAFGVVYEGLLKGEKVAVKRLKESVAGPKQVAKILDEAYNMSDFDHDNVLPLIGVAIGDEDGMPQLITPFMAGGDLLTFLRQHSLPDRGSGKHLALAVQVDIALQVAKGMNYLTEQNFIHRDLAARNCMLTEDMRVKVGDFGLGRDIHEDSYYKVSTEWCLPVKWMALESLQYHRFSSQSDVWSHGVLLYEIFTCGAAPYAGVANVEVMPYLLAGNRLTKPTYCPDYIYSLMRSCWESAATDRPTFADIVDQLQSYSACGDVRRDSGDVYVNAQASTPSSGPAGTREVQRTSGHGSHGSHARRRAEPGQKSSGPCIAYENTKAEAAPAAEKLRCYGNIEENYLEEEGSVS